MMQPVRLLVSENSTRFSVTGLLGWFFPGIWIFNGVFPGTLHHCVPWGNNIQTVSCLTLLRMVLCWGSPIHSRWITSQICVHGWELSAYQTVEQQEKGMALRPYFILFPRIARSMKSYMKTRTVRWVKAIYKFTPSAFGATHCGINPNNW